MILFAGAMVWTGIRLLKNFRIDEYTQLNVSQETSIEADSVLDTTNSLLEEKQSSNFSSIFIFGIIMMFISLFLTSVNDFITHPFIQPYLIEVLDAEFWMILLAYTPGGIISYLLAPQLGKIADKINPYWGITIVSVGGALLTFWLVNVSHIWMFGLIFLLDRGFALTGALLIKSFVSRISISKRGRNIGFSWSIAQIGGVIGPILGGVLWDGFDNPKMPFIVSIFVEIGLIVFYIVGIYMTRNHIEESLEK
jgi:MFS family permease